MKRKCDICGFKTERKDSQRKFFMARFSLDAVRCRKWIKVTGNEDLFLAELTKLFQKARTSGSVTMTMKRYDGRTKPHPRDGTPAVKNPEYKCLIRAQSRNKKISTVIEQKDVEIFSTAYSNLLKTSMNGLKRLKKPKKKALATQ